MCERNIAFDARVAREAPRARARARAAKLVFARRALPANRVAYLCANCKIISRTRARDINNAKLREQTKSRRGERDRRSLGDRVRACICARVGEDPGRGLREKKRERGTRGQKSSRKPNDDYLSRPPESRYFPVIVLCVINTPIQHVSAIVLHGVIALPTREKGKLGEKSVLVASR